MTSTAPTFGAALGDRTVPCGPDQPLLDAFLRAGVWMPNSCNQGTCGTCKLRVVRGDVDHRDSPADTLTAAERAAGLALACQARPRSDLTLALDGPAAAAGRTAHPLRDLVGTVVELADVARDTRRLRIALGEPLAFDAGQYVELTVPGSGVRRQYSLANTADVDKVLELHVRLVPGGAATAGWIFDSLRVDDEIEVSGPFGDFVLDDAEGPMVMIGGGTGLAPLVGLARTALARDPGREIHLYHGVRGAADLYDGDAMAELAARYSGFRFVPVLSHEPDPDHRSGLPTDAFVEDVPSARGWSGWLCGPPAMVDAGVKAFKRRRMAPRLIHRENFTPAC